MWPLQVKGFPQPGSGESPPFRNHALGAALRYKDRVCGDSKATATEPLQVMEDIELSAEQIALLIDYARRKYAEERYPLSPELRPVREAIQKLRPKPPPLPPAPARPYVPSTVMQKAKRRR